MNALDFAPLLVIIVLLSGLAAHYLLERRRRANAGSPSNRQFSGPIYREDDRYWLGGVIYYNPDDPDLLVPKRYGLGLGQTLNFGHPRAKWFILGTLVVILLLTSLGALAPHTGTHPF